MSPRSNPMKLTLVAGVIACSLAACSKDAPTDLTDEPAPGGHLTDISALAAPANDDFDNATVITALPFTTNFNTAEATTAPDDPLGDDLCGFGSVDGHTVWYQFTPTQDMRLNANTAGTRGFGHNIFVYTGTRGNLTRVTCNFLPLSATFDAQAGVTYYFLVGSEGDAPGQEGVFTLQLALDVTLTIDHVGDLNLSTGTVPIRGTATCSRSASVEVGVVSVRRRDVAGSVDLPFSGCDGVTPWEVEIVFEGRFPPGPAEVRVGGLFIDNSSTEEVQASASTSVILKPDR
jgi:hypothetical protein